MPRHRNPDQQQEQALCLTLIVNAIVLWNTIYIQLALDQLRAEGQLITTSELEGIAPVQRAHLHAYGDTRSTSPPARTATGPSDSPHNASEPTRAIP